MCYKNAGYLSPHLLPTVGTIFRCCPCAVIKSWPMSKNVGAPMAPRFTKFQLLPLWWMLSNPNLYWVLHSTGDIKDSTKSLWRSVKKTSYVFNIKGCPLIVFLIEELLFFAFTQKKLLTHQEYHKHLFILKGNPSLKCLIEELLFLYFTTIHYCTIKDHC